MCYLCAIDRLVCRQVGKQVQDNHSTSPHDMNRASGRLYLVLRSNGLYGVLPYGKITCFNKIQICLYQFIVLSCSTIKISVLEGKQVPICGNIETRRVKRLRFVKKTSLNRLLRKILILDSVWICCNRFCLISLSSFSLEENVSNDFFILTVHQIVFQILLNLAAAARLPKAFCCWINLKENGHRGAAIAQLICLLLPSCCPGFKSQAHHQRFFHLQSNVYKYICL